MSVASYELNTAEIAYAAINQIDKVQLVCEIKSIDIREKQMACLSVMKGNMKEAETILISSGMIYRCIQMYLEMFQWDKALEIAKKTNKHVDIVVFFRRKYLNQLGIKESKRNFIEISENNLDLDEDKIQIKIEQEEQNEKSLSKRVKKV